MSTEDNVLNENMSCKRSINKTYPLSTRKESLHVLAFLLNWNLKNELDYCVKFSLNKYAVHYEMPSCTALTRK